MATKKAKNSHRKATSKAATKPEAQPRSAIPYERIARLYSQGKPISDIARAVGRYNEHSEDPTHSIRAILSGMVTRGYRNSKGEVVKLVKRPRVKVEEPKSKKATVKTYPVKMNGKVHHVTVPDAETTK